jgi:arsenite oxidase small subunit
MTPAEPDHDWLEQGLEGNIPVLYDNSSKGHISKNEALSSLRKLQRYIGYVMLLSAATVVYLLATDGSLWVLAVSHAIGLVIIVILDVFLGILNLLGTRRVYVASLAAAVLGIALQLGDVATAPQYGMSVAYFASYLFGLVAFDALLLLQGIVIILGIAGRSSVGFLASRRRVSNELNYSRRSFVTTIVGFAALIGLGVALGSVKLPSTSSSPAGSAQVASPTTPIANTSYLQVDSPVYFEYPSGYPNVLFKRSDGNLAAFSLLCTHVCCETTYEASSSIFYCPCHGSEFDSSGNVIRGPASSPLPTITLTVDNSGNVYAAGVSGSTPC